MAEKTEPVRKAVILAAGQGKRLLPLTERTPKCLLDLGGGKTVLERLLDNLADAGCQEVALVVGFCEEQVEARIGSRYRGMAIHYIINPIYHSTNNIYSVWLAHGFGKDGFLLINGDDVLHSGIVKNLVQSQHADAAVIDLSKTDLPDEAMKATIKEGKLAAVSKKIPKSETSGDAIGAYKFSKDGAAAMFGQIKKMLVAGEQDTWYLAALDQVCKQHSFFAVDTAGLWWAEVDDPSDLAAARALVAKTDVRH